MTPRVLVALDSFKGSIDSGSAGRAVAAGLLRARPDVQVTVMVMGDGGEGTKDALRAASADSLEITAQILDQNRTPARGEFLLLDSRTAYIESATAVALPQAELPPLQRTSFGVGQMVLAAVERGATRVLVGCGGTGTVDAGIGLLWALAGRTPPGPELQTVDETLEVAELAARNLGDADLVAIADVSNPLGGPAGAAVFIPQKVPDRGQWPVVGRYLDDMATVYDEVARRRGQAPVSDQVGAGAAGGLPAAMFLLGASCQSGLDLVCAEVGFDAAAAGATLLVTGEGRLDRSTFDGKLTSGLLQRAGCRAVIVAGGATADGRTLAREAGAAAVYTLVEEQGLDEALARPHIGLERIGAELARLLPSPT